MAPIHVFHASSAAPLAALVRDAAPGREVVTLPDHAALAEALPIVEVLFAPMPPRDGWAAATRLRLVQLAGAGADHFLPAEGLRPDVEVAGLRGLYADAAAEHAVAVILALVHGLPDALERQRARRWVQRPVPRLRGRRAVILGYGSIGRATGRLLEALGVSVVGVRRRPGPGERGPTELLAALEGADVLVLSAPLTDETRGLVDAVALAALPDHAIVVDVGRAGVIDEGALLAALREGRLSVARDVFDDEPLSEDSPFWTASRCLVTPHVAGYVPGYLEGAVAVLLDNVARLESGAPRRRLIDRASEY